MISWIASSQRSLASLALTSKQFLSPARIYLYSRPLIDASSFTWHKATKLADTLTLSNLSGLVASLEGIVLCMFKLSKLSAPSRSLPYHVRGCTKVFSWYLAILSACPSLVEIDIYWQELATLDRIEKAFDPSTSTLRTVNFVDTDGFLPREQRLNTAHVNDTLSRSPFGEVEVIKLINIDYIANTRISHPVQVLHLENTRGWRQSLLDFGLDDLSRFHTLQIDSETKSFDGLPDLVYPLGVQLRHFISKPCTPSEDCTPTIKTYGDLYKLTVFFSNARNLTSVTVTHSKADFMSILDVLASSSPLLASLNFHGSHWLQKGDRWFKRLGLSFEARFGPACIAADLEDLLKRMHRLEFADLGVLPTTDPEAYELVVVGLRERGIKVMWRCCRKDDTCMDCGAVHS